MRALWTIWLIFPCWALLAQDELDVETAGNAEPAPGEFLAFSGHDVTPVTDWFPEMVKPEMWPQVKSPKKFNRSFEKPTAVWKTAGGYFASFDRGEFGGALFFAAEGARTWTKVLSRNVQDLGQFSGSSFLAVGGLAHMEFSGGSVHLISQRPDGGWKTRVLMTSGWGVPALIGESVTRDPLEPKAPRLLVVGIADPSDEKRVSLVGFDIDGTTHFLGPKPALTNEAKREPSPAPATPAPDQE